ncbi:uncharacterized protein TNCV_788491 [Trichonephila clavipes]|nr:uncharacterized protein TNCV_788491 [Trichonephila clavipes]
MRGKFTPGYCISKGTLVAAVAEWSSYRIVAGFVTSSSPVPLKTHRVRAPMHVKSLESSNVLPLDRVVIQVRRITIKKDAEVIPTKHLILTFNNPKLPTTIKAGYLNCKIRPYIPNPLRCFKCQRFGHSQTSCRGQLTCSRCASVGHSSTDCTLELKLSTRSSSDSKLCPKWKIEKQIQEIKTNNNISYQEARKLIAPQFSQTYAQVAKPSIATSTTQTDENITKASAHLYKYLNLYYPYLIQMHILQLLQIPHRRLPLRQTSCPPHLQ